MNVWHLVRNPWKTKKEILYGRSKVIITPQLRQWLVARHQRLVRRRLKAVWRLVRSKVRRWLWRR